MKRTLEILNALEREGVISRYAIGEGQWERRFTSNRC